MPWLFGASCFVAALVPGLLAASSSGGDPTLPLFAQYGLLAPLLAFCVWSYRREANRADRLEQKLLEALPSLSEATKAVNDSNVVLREVGELLRRRTS